MRPQHKSETLKPEGLSIGEAAKALGISVHTLRMYERSGLIVPHKKPSGQRVYYENDLERVRCIRTAISEQKISIAGIRRIHSLIPCWNILPCSAEDRRHCEAYSGNVAGCWTFRHTSNTCAGRDCASCIVYTEFNDCGAIKNTIRLLTSDHESPLP